MILDHGTEPTVLFALCTIIHGGDGHIDFCEEGAVSSHPAGWLFLLSTIFNRENQRTGKDAGKWALQGKRGFS